MPAIASPSPNLAIVVDYTRRHVWRFAVFMCVVNLVVPVAQYLYAVSTGEVFWRMFRGEDNVTNWVSGIQLLIIAGAAYFNQRLLALTPETVPGERNEWIWPVVAAGFVLFALDEQFDIHEALRSYVFQPAGVLVRVSWLKSGDVGLYLFFFIGLAFSPFLHVELRRNRASVALYWAALALTLPTIVIDSMKNSAMESWPHYRVWDYPFEEIGETWAQLLFLLSFLGVLRSRLEDYARPRASPAGMTSASSGDP